LRACDLAYRLGGEEFAILLPGADLPTTAVVAHQLHGQPPVLCAAGCQSTEGR
jgi:GGDEF domain-containing protein